MLCLKDLCKFFDLDWKADKDQLIERCVNFLMKPTATKMTSLDALNESRKKKRSGRHESTPSKKRKQSSKKQKVVVVPKEKEKTSSDARLCRRPQPPKRHARSSDLRNSTSRNKSKKPNIG